jgi:hypothetical protein
MRQLLPSSVSVTRAAIALLAALLAMQAPRVLAQGQPSAPQNQLPAADNSTIGSVATVTGGPIVMRGDKQYSLATGNELFQGDILQTGAGGGLGVTFDDETTLTLGANTRVSISDYVYGKANARSTAVINVLRGTLAFVAGQVAKTGDMKISTPTASLGIRGTTGLVDVPVDQSGAPGETKIKLYRDQGGTVGRIEIFDNNGARLGLLSRASTGFAIRPDQAMSRSSGRPRFAAVELRMTPSEMARDRSQVRQLFSVHTLGRQMINIRRGLPPGTRPTPGQNQLRGQGRAPGLQQTPNFQQNLQQNPGLRGAPRTRGQRGMRGQQNTPTDYRNTNRKQQRR